MTKNLLPVLRRYVASILHPGHVYMNLGLANGERVDAWVRTKDAVRIWHA